MGKVVCGHLPSDKDSFLLVECVTQALTDFAKEEEFVNEHSSSVIRVQDVDVLLAGIPFHICAFQCVRLDNLLRLFNNLFNRHLASILSMSPAPPQVVDQRM